MRNVLILAFILFCLSVQAQYVAGSSQMTATIQLSDAQTAIVADTLQPAWTVPSWLNNRKISKISAVTNGDQTGTTTLYLHKNGIATSHFVSLLVSEESDESIVTPEITLATGDYFTVECTATGEHKGVVFQIQIR